MQDNDSTRRPEDLEPAAAGPLEKAAAGHFTQGDHSGRPEHSGPVNPKWGKAAVQREADQAGAPGSPGVSPGAPGGGTSGGGSPGGGAWIWMPQGFCPGQSKKPWRKRHPILFWGGVILVLAMVFNWGRVSVESGPMSGPKIAVVEVEGLILDSSAIINYMEKVRVNSDYKGAIIRINSPGGAVGPSQELYSAVKRLSLAKPTVASMGALAASGGYYTAVGAPLIFASPSTLTASIGVRMQVPNFEGLMHIIGVSEKTLATGKLKDAGSSFRTMTGEEESYFRELLGDMYEEFISTVAKERKIPLEEVRKMADGRAMTGRQALNSGLVDKLGDLHDATIALLGQCGISDPKSVKIVTGPEKPSTYLRDLVGSLLDTNVEQASRPLFLFY